MATTIRKYKGTYCSAIGCNNNRMNYDGTIFRFPRNEDRSKRWVMSCRRQDLMSKSAEYLAKNCSICAEHFAEADFTNELKRRLVWSAVPSIFQFNNGKDLPKRITRKTRALWQKIVEIEPEIAQKSTQCKEEDLDIVQKEPKDVTTNGTSTSAAVAITQYTIPMAEEEPSMPICDEVTVETDSPSAILLNKCLPSVEPPTKVPDFEFSFKNNSRLVEDLDLFFQLGWAVRLLPDVVVLIYLDDKNTSTLSLTIDRESGTFYVQIFGQILPKTHEIFRGVGMVQRLETLKDLQGLLRHLANCNVCKGYGEAEYLKNFLSTDRWRNVMFIRSNTESLHSLDCTHVTLKKGRCPDCQKLESMFRRQRNYY